MNVNIDNFVSGKPSLTGETDWLKAMRSRGLERFELLGIPTTKNEDWKYTNLRAMASKQFELETTAANSTARYDDLLGGSVAHCRIVFVGGVFKAELSNMDALPKGVLFLPMAQALKKEANQIESILGSAMPDEENAFASLNLGLFGDGAFIKIAAKQEIEVPIELVHITQGEQTLALPRHLIILEAGASATLLERQLSEENSNGLCNSATEIFLAEQAKLDYNLIQLQADKASHIGGTWVKQTAGSEFTAHTVTLGGQLVRNELLVSLEGEEANVDCSALYYGRKHQHIDNHTTFIHSAPNCKSRELYKGILDDRARGVFHGRIVVKQDAQLTVSEQENPNLLLSRDAEVDSKPQLEIYADDVICAHGATVGELDAKQVFYMQSRGIDVQTAKTLLTYAFAAQVVEGIKIKSLREELAKVIEKAMHLSGISEMKQ